ncbi:MAG: 4-phosphoerythronate dehydrogenase [Salinivenus sp.]
MRSLSLSIIADENIPCVQEAFGRFGSVKTVPGHEISQKGVGSADVLLVRSVTPITPELVDGSDVRFVGSATIGTDHVDQEHLAEEGISFAHAPASNADSVADYVVAALLTLARTQRVSLAGGTVGIVGCGNTGGRLARRLSALGLHVLQNDPPRAEEETPPPDFVSLDTVLRNADILTLHVPLTREGPHPTHRLIGDKEVSCMRKGAWLVNTSRGNVVDPEALRSAANSGHLGGLVLDVWPREPTPDPDLIRAADIATPHIAGYAYDGKVRGTYMLYEALCQHLGIEPAWDPQAVLRPSDPNALRAVPPDPRLPPSGALHRLARQAYDVMEDDARVRALSSRPADERAAAFRHLRKTYPRRREFQRYGVPLSAIPKALRQAVREGLTMQLTGSSCYER